MRNQESKFFNLLVLNKINEGIWDKIYNWIVWRARIAILIVEIIVVIVFFLKVIEDTNAKNKDKNLTVALAELDFLSKSNEAEILQIQKKANLYKLLWNGSSNIVPVVAEINSLAGESAKNITIRYSSNKITIFGYEDLQLLERLESNLKNNAKLLKKESVKVVSLSLNDTDINLGKAQIALEAEILDSNLRSNIQ